MPRPATRIGCSIHRCERAHHANGLCNVHYRVSSRSEEEINLEPLSGAEGLLDPEQGAQGSKTPIPIRAFVAPGEEIRCPDCGKRYGLSHGWGWHCRSCHRTWAAGCPCECGLSLDWKRRPTSVATGKRTRPSKPLQKAILEEQKNRCFYCQFEFGTIFRRHNKPFALKLNWDHFIPYSYSLANATDNWVAACHICNGIKGCLVFSTADRARTFVNERREAKGYVLDENERLYLERVSA